MDGIKTDDHTYQDQLVHEYVQTHVFGIETNTYFLSVIRRQLSCVVNALTESSLKRGSVLGTKLNNIEIKKTN
jgi:hypothetical protein